MQKDEKEEFSGMPRSPHSPSFATKSVCVGNELCIVGWLFAGECGLFLSFILEFCHTNIIDERLVNYICPSMNQVDRHYLFVESSPASVDIVVFFACTGINPSFFPNEQMYQYILLPCTWLFLSRLNISLTDRCWYTCIYRYILPKRYRGAMHHIE